MGTSATCPWKLPCSWLAPSLPHTAASAVRLPPPGGQEAIINAAAATDLVSWCLLAPQHQDSRQPGRGSSSPR
ncbi:hypothetical protein MC885_002740 [Smutsia gigantea]|nr:hypothetical protein MC885_002740 [Smutsia gigantea]